MTREDARFEDATESPISLRAFDREDLGIISALVQDAVLPATEIRWLPRKRRLALLINRFRWERPETARPERVQSVLAFEDVMAVASQGFDRNEKDLVLSLLSIEAGEDAEGQTRLEIVLAGDGAIALRVEAIEVTLKDVTRPYSAPSGKAPSHDG